MRYVQPANMTPQHYAGDLVATSCNVTEVYDEGTLNDVILKGVGVSAAIVTATIEHRTHKRI